MKAHLHVSLLAAIALAIVGRLILSAAAPREGIASAASAASAAQENNLRELDQGPPRHVTFRPDEVEWKDGPASFEKGARYAVLEGNPAEPGFFTLQIRMPDGFVINPHWHPNVERVTVLRGTFLLGAGKSVDKDAAERLPAGTYTSMPKRMIHHAIADGETVIQLTTIGPWEINYVNPKHDPRRRQRD